MLYSKFGTNTKLEAEAGVRLDLGGGVAITILRAGGSNRKYITYARAKFQANRYKLEKDLMSDTEANELNADIYAETIIVSWEGVTDKDGKVLQFTKENVVKVLLDLPELFSLIKAEAEKFENFHQEEIGQDEKN